MSKRRLGLFSPSASYTALVLSGCTHWMQPGSQWYDEQYVDKEKAERGTRVHHAVYKTGTDPFYTPTLVAGEMVMLNRAKARLAEYQAAGYTLHYEIAMGWDPMSPSDTALIYAGVEDRGYPMDALNHGSCDLIGVKGNDLLVADWKTGGGTGVKKQLLTLAAMYCYATRMRPESVTLVAEYIGDDDTKEAWTVSWGDVVNHASAYAAALVAPSAGPRPGPHCTQLYCAHLAFCDATASLPAAMGESVTFTDDPLSDQEAGNMLDGIRRLERKLKYFKEAAKVYVKRGGKPRFGDEVWDNSGGDFRWKRSK
jgi:hypothetical protein